MTAHPTPMTQQTTPRKTVEMIVNECVDRLDECIEVSCNEYEGFNSGCAKELILRAINQAVADAVKGSGAVEALESCGAYDDYAGGNDEHIRKAFTALRALTLPDQPNK